MGDVDTIGLCSRCRALNISHSTFEPWRDSNSFNPGTVNLGFLHELFERRRACTFCDLVCKAIYNSRNTEIAYDGYDITGDQVACFADWPQKSYIDQNRRLRIFNDESLFVPAYIVPLHASDSNSGSGFDSDLIPLDFEDVRGWIKSCEDDHKGCSMYQPRVRSTTRLRVIDTLRECLVEMQGNFRYCTLSYCWGNDPAPMMLTNDTLETFKLPGIFSQQQYNPPRTIRDAINFVSNIGERYLWVDRLCLVQDNSLEVDQISPRMDSIYGQSVLTICAATADNANNGLFGRYSFSRNSFQAKGRYGKLDLGILKSLDDQISSSAWITRAWTYQERMLSPRCLVIVNEDIFFLCHRNAQKLEAGITQSEIAALQIIGTPSSLFTSKVHSVDRFAHSLELYSGRHLSRYSDKLMAYDGIANVLSNPTYPGSIGLEFSYGLPRSHFDWALLWEPKDRPRRLDKSVAAGKTLPSWSWCGWAGSSHWNRSAMVEIRMDLHHWLMHHTWIIWYVGTEEGHDMLLSAGDDTSQSRLGQDFQRWNGYSPANMDEVDFFGRPLLRECQKNIDTYPNWPTHDAIEGCLNFWTWSSFLRISGREAAPFIKATTVLAPGVRRYGILDANDQLCGTVNLDESYSAHVNEVFQFIAVSDAHGEHNRPGQASESGFFYYYALLIVWTVPGVVAERVGLAQIRRENFHNASLSPGVTWQEITLG